MGDPASTRSKGRGAQRVTAGRAHDLVNGYWEVMHRTEHAKRPYKVPGKTRDSRRHVAQSWCPPLGLLLSRWKQLPAIRTRAQEPRGVVQGHGFALSPAATLLAPGHPGPLKGGMGRLGSRTWLLVRMPRRPLRLPDRFTGAHKRFPNRGQPGPQALRDTCEHRVPRLGFPPPVQTCSGSQPLGPGWFWRCMIAH